MSDVVARVDQQIAGRRLLDHPFYQAWSKGELTLEALRTYATQYYRWVEAFPTWLSATHANTPDLASRQAILANLVDEEQGPDHHPELWLRFCDALGLDREAVRRAEPLPETEEALAAMRAACRAEPAARGLAALYAYESQQPEVMRTKREGLRDRYGIAAGHDYFELHEVLDVDHSATERALLSAAAEGCEAEVEQAAAAALDATWRLLDGVERARTSR